MKVHKVKKIKIVILSPMFYDTKTTLCTFGKYVLVKIGNVFLGADNKRVNTILDDIACVNFDIFCSYQRCSVKHIKDSI